MTNEDEQLERAIVAMEKAASAFVRLASAVENTGASFNRIAVVLEQAQAEEALDNTGGR